MSRIQIILTVIGAGFAAVNYVIYWAAGRANALPGAPLVLCCVVLPLLFCLLVFRGFYIAAKAKDKFGMLVAVGLTMHIGLQALLNIAVVSNAIPNTGISLPFFSYGGTALMMQLAEMGILLNISRQAKLN